MKTALRMVIANNFISFCWLFKGVAKLKYLSEALDSRRAWDDVYLVQMAATTISRHILPKEELTLFTSQGKSLWIFIAWSERVNNLFCFPSQNKPHKRLSYLCGVLCILKVLQKVSPKNVDQEKNVTVPFHLLAEVLVSKSLLCPRDACWVKGSKVLQTSNPNSLSPPA